MRVVEKICVSGVIVGGGKFLGSFLLGSFSVN